MDTISISFLPRTKKLLNGPGNPDYDFSSRGEPTLCHPDPVRHAKIRGPHGSYIRPYSRGVERIELEYGKAFNVCMAQKIMKWSRRMLPAPPMPRE